MPLDLAILRPTAAGDAERILRHYFRQDAPMSHTGGRWDTFDPSRTRAESADVFTVDDLVSCSLLSTPIGGPAALDLLGNPHVYTRMLTAIGPDQEFVDIDIPGPTFDAMNATYRTLRAIPGVGQTRTTKLLARKRPQLVPIVDSVIRMTAFGGSREHWRPLHAALRANDRSLHRHLQELHDRAQLPAKVTTLRVFDVLVWWTGREFPIPHS